MPTLKMTLRAVIVVCVIIGGCAMIGMPGASYRGPLPPLTREETVLRENLQRHVGHLAGEIGERNTARYRELQQSARYIAENLQTSGYQVRELPYIVGGKTVANLEAEISGSTRAKEIVVVGAHYDSVLGTAGANDNASGVGALLEIARLFREINPERTVRFVAFVNEEPPYFQTEQMGSMVYARMAKSRNDDVVAMYSLETIGFYSDQPGSQKYPPPLASFFPDTGNFIGFVGNLGSWDLLRRAVGAFRDTTRFPSEGVAAPEFITGIGWSDQWAFWQVGYPGLMVTDTAPFRYPEYHEAADTPDKLDYERLARVTAGIARVLAREASPAAR